MDFQIHKVFAGNPSVLNFIPQVVGKHSPGNLRELLAGGLNRPPTGSPFKWGSARRYSELGLKWNFPTHSLLPEVNISEPTCHRFPHGQLPMWWLPTGRLLVDEHCWVTPGGPLSSEYTGYKAHLPKVFSIDRVNTLEAPVSRLAKTPTSIRNKNQNSFSARVLGGKFWSQTKRRGGSLKGLAFSQLQTLANLDGGR